MPAEGLLAIVGGKPGKSEKSEKSSEPSSAKARALKAFKEALDAKDWAAAEEHFQEAYDECAMSGGDEEEAEADEDFLDESEE
jgi:hypothetical protein